MALNDSTVDTVGDQLPIALLSAAQAGVFLNLRRRASHSHPSAVTIMPFRDAQPKTQEITAVLRLKTEAAPI